PYSSVSMRTRSHAPAARDGRASVRHDEGAHGGDALPHQNAAQGRRRDGPLSACLQFDARHEHRRHQAADRGNRGLRRLGFGRYVASEPLRMAERHTRLPPRPNRQNMLETDYDAAHPACRGLQVSPPALYHRPKPRSDPPVRHPPADPPAWLSTELSEPTQTWRRYRHERAFDRASIPSFSTPMRAMHFCITVHPS